MRAAWQQRDFGKPDALLNASIPSDSEPDFRGWEWYFLKSQVRSRFRKLQFGDVSPGGPIAWCEATRNLATVSNEHDVQIWDVDHEEELFNVSFDPAISVMEFSPQGDWLSVGTHSGEFSLIDLEDQRVAVSDPFATQLERHRRIQAISWKPDGTQVAILVRFGIIAIRDIGSGTVEILHRPNHPRMMEILPGIRTNHFWPPGCDMGNAGFMTCRRANSSRFRESVNKLATDCRGILPGNGWRLPSITTSELLIPRGAQRDTCEVIWDK